MLQTKELMDKINRLKSVFSLDFFLKFNWLITVLFFLLVLFFSLFIWLQSFVFSSSALDPQLLSQENNQDFERKDGQIKKVIEAMEKRREGFEHFPPEALPRERVFKSEFVWDEESAPPAEETTDKEADQSDSQDRIAF